MSTIPKTIFSLQRLTRDPLVIRSIARQTGMTSDEVKCKISSLRSTRDPFVKVLQKTADRNEIQYHH